MSLLQRFLDAKARETKARADRIELELELAECLECPEGGSKTHELEGYKVTVKRPINTRVDWDAFLSVGVADRLLPVKNKPALDPDGWAYLRNKEPEIYSQLAAHVTNTPGKPALTVKA